MPHFRSGLVKFILSIQRYWKSENAGVVFEKATLLLFYTILPESALLILSAATAVLRLHFPMSRGAHADISNSLPPIPHRKTLAIEAPTSLSSSMTVRSKTAEQRPELEQGV